MKNNAAMRQQSATAPAATHDERVKLARRDPAAPPVPADTASAGAPERTVLRELHRMFALIAIR